MGFDIHVSMNDLGKLFLKRYILNYGLFPSPNKQRSNPRLPFITQSFTNCLLNVETKRHMNECYNKNEKVFMCVKL